MVLYIVGGKAFNESNYLKTSSNKEENCLETFNKNLLDKKRAEYLKYAH